MSDIGINLSGIIALFVFLAAAAGLGLFGLASLVVAFVNASKTGQPVKNHVAFAYFIAAVPLLIVNLIAFGILLLIVDSNAHESNESIDKAALFVWLPLQLISWIILGLFLKRIRK